MKEVKNEIKKDVKKDEKKENPEPAGGLALKMTKSEMEVVTTVFRSFETGLRRASILPKVE